MWTGSGGQRTEDSGDSGEIPCTLETTYFLCITSWTVALCKLGADGIKILGVMI
jgi:hypothetical protein